MSTEYIYECSNRKFVIIEVSDNGEDVEVFTQDKQKIGSFHFYTRSEDRYEYLYLYNMHLEELNGAYLQQGIGRECLKRAIEISGLTIEAAEDDGNVNEDGSHLTGKGVGFVRKMRQEGYIK